MNVQSSSNRISNWISNRPKNAQTDRQTDIQTGHTDRHKTYVRKLNSQSASAGCAKRKQFPARFPTNLPAKNWPQLPAKLPTKLPAKLPTKLPAKLHAKFFPRNPPRPCASGRLMGMSSKQTNKLGPTENLDLQMPYALPNEMKINLMVPKSTQNHFWKPTQIPMMLPNHKKNPYNSPQINPKSAKIKYNHPWEPPWVPTNPKGLTEAIWRDLKKLFWIAPNRPRASKNLPWRSPKHPCVIISFSAKICQHFRAQSW